MFQTSLQGRRKRHWCYSPVLTSFTFCELKEIKETPLNHKFLWYFLQLTQHCEQNYCMQVGHPNTSKSKVIHLKWKTTSQSLLCCSAHIFRNSLGPNFFFLILFVRIERDRTTSQLWRILETLPSQGQNRNWLTRSRAGADSLTWMVTTSMPVSCQLTLQVAGKLIVFCYLWMMHCLCVSENLKNPLTKRALSWCALDLSEREFAERISCHCLFVLEKVNMCLTVPDLRLFICLLERITFVIFMEVEEDYLCAYEASMAYGCHKGISIDKTVSTKPHFCQKRHPRLQHHFWPFPVYKPPTPISLASLDNWTREHAVVIGQKLWGGRHLIQSRGDPLLVQRTQRKNRQLPGSDAGMFLKQPRTWYPRARN